MYVCILNEIDKVLVYEPPFYFFMGGLVGETFLFYSSNCLLLPHFDLFVSLVDCNSVRYCSIISVS